MNRFLHTFCIVLTLNLVFICDVLAQQKTAYVDTDFLISKIPEYESIQQQLSLLSQEWRSELEKMQQNIDNLKEDFAAKEILYTDEIREQRQQEIQNAVQQRQQYLEQKFGPKGEYFQKQKELLEPIQRRVFEAITAVAERDGYDFIFDRSQNTSILYTRKQWNLNDEVLFELGISPDETSN